MTLKEHLELIKIGFKDYGLFKNGICVPFPVTKHDGGFIVKSKRWMSWKQRRIWKRIKKETEQEKTYFTYHLDHEDCKNGVCSENEVGSIISPQLLKERCERADSMKD